MNEMMEIDGDKQSKSAVTVGQRYEPDDDALADLLRRIYKNKYYTNHGPLAVEFESSLSSYLNVRNAVVSTNATLALLMTLIALDVKGTVVVPSLCSPGVVEAVIWAGLTPVFCDIDKVTGHMTAETVKDVIDEDTGIIIATSLWGNVCEIGDLVGIYGRAGLKIIHYAEGAFGLVVNGEILGCDSEAAIFSFDSANILSTSGGGCMATNNELLARKVRNIRSSYGAGAPEKVPVTANGRFSEYQAALGLWSLSRLEFHRARNKSIIDTYKQSLKGINGVQFLKEREHVNSNYQDAVLITQDTESGVTRDRILSVLEEHNIFTMGRYRAYYDNTDVFSSWCDGCDFPNMTHLSNTSLYLPVGSRVTPALAEKIGALVGSCFH
ncbi:MAG: DegT/DnrJ/EryC1/StrS family aminotransferase [Gammaproteobacteria bacterium]